MSGQSYCILIEDRDYTSWKIQDPETNELMDINYQDKTWANFMPGQHQLFSKDVFRFHENGTVVLSYSPVRSTNVLAGVLQLQDNRTFGRTQNKKRLLYKCIPDDKRLPVFLVPYEPKIDFIKTRPNKYVVFRFYHWNDKHPNGILMETLGDVDKLDAFYEYQLYCKSLHTSIQEMTFHARTAVNKKTTQEFVEQICNHAEFNICNRIDDYIFTIDPKNSLDFDDGFSINRDPISPNNYIVSVYIANVYVWLETLGLWNSFSERVSTIYLPDRRRPMLPTVLSDALCSLQEGEDRFAFVMDITVDKDGQLVQDCPPRFCNAHVRVSKNYRYDDVSLLKDPLYNHLAILTAKMNNRLHMSSHDVVAFWMVQMNGHCGKLLASKQKGIFRSAVFTDANMRSDVEDVQSIDEETKRVIRTFNNTTGQYLAYSEEIIPYHELMKIKTYVHITSPIRRIVDLLNNMVFCSEFTGLTISADARRFLEHWMSRLDYVNISMRSIRKVQTDCELLYRCSNDPRMLDGIHEGVIFDRIVKNNGLFSYMAYIEKWKLLSRVTLHHDIENYSRAQFRMFLFEREDKTKRKIRLSYVENTETNVLDVPRISYAFL